MSQSDPVDRTVLDGLLDSLGGDKEFLTELLQTYLEDSPRLLAAMRTALLAGNAEDFRRAAHTLKSNSASFGAMTLSRLARALEELGKAGTLASAAADLAQAEAEYARVRAALEAAAR
jgi:HPt (histidine-containing phosphotransfer) domain-containing protein